MPNRAAEVTTLNAEPGGYRPLNARLPPSVSATARIWPDRASMATIAEGCPTPSSARAAAAWTAWEIVLRVSGCGGVGEARSTRPEGTSSSFRVTTVASSPVK